MTGQSAFGILNDTKRRKVSLEKYKLTVFEQKFCSFEERDKHICDAKVSSEDCEFGILGTCLPHTETDHPMTCRPVL